MTSMSLVAGLQEGNISLSIKSYQIIYFLYISLIVFHPFVRKVEKKHLQTVILSTDHHPQYIYFVSIEFQYIEFYLFYIQSDCTETSKKFHALAMIIVLKWKIIIAFTPPEFNSSKTINNKKFIFKYINFNWKFR